MNTVRLARENEVPHLSAIGLAAWETAVAGLVDAQAMGRVAQLAFLSFLRENWLLVSVVEANGVAVGWAACENGDGEISDIWVAPQFQRHGLGSSLLADVETRIRTEGFDTVSIKTHAQNDRAIGFFRKHDYSVRWLLTAYSAKLDRDVDSIGMAKVFVERTAVSDHQEWF